METINNYTHTDVRIKDIRLKKGKNNKDDFFAIQISSPGINVVFVNYNIFNDRVKSFFLGKDVNEVPRNELLSLRWNFIITSGYYLKIVAKNQFEKLPGTPEKQYVSVLDVAGPISEFANNFASEVEIYENTKYLDPRNHE